ncbi:MAG: formate/nitrite transporter family protein [Leeuwenhoekiella sp.]
MSEEEKKKQQEEIDNELENSESSDIASRKTHGEILKEQIIEGQETYNRSTSSILLSSLTAGLEIGFSYLLLCSLGSFLYGKVGEDVIVKARSLVYPIGFVLVILGQSILFTEQTSLLSLPVLNNKRSIRSLFRLWGTVILGNLLGGCFMAILITWIGSQLHIFSSQTVLRIAEHVTGVDNTVIFVSAILAGWLMGLLSWLLTSSKETISRIVLIFIVTGVMAFTDLHHSIIGNVEVFAGLLNGSSITIWQYVSFEGIALMGNAIGGVFFVALLKYRAFVYDVGGA